MNLPKKVLIVTVEFDGSKPDFEHKAARLAKPIANVPGLVWKVWLRHPEGDSAGGVYLFESERDLQDFIDGPIAAEINNRSGFTNVSMKVFDIMEEPSRTTRAPLDGPPGAADRDDKI
jgi:hypothetical protein